MNGEMPSERDQIPRLADLIRRRAESMPTRKAVAAPPGADGGTVG